MNVAFEVKGSVRVKIESEDRRMTCEYGSDLAEYVTCYNAGSVNER